MTLTTILKAAISSSKNVVPKTIQNAPSNIALPLSSMAVAYASSLPSKPLAQDRHRKQDLPQRIVDDRRMYHDSLAHRSHQRLPVIIESNSDRIIDPFLGNLLDGFCNGSCYNTNIR